jgi:hypothetical protein
MKNLQTQIIFHSYSWFNNLKKNYYIIIIIIIFIVFHYLPYIRLIKER